MGASDHSNDSPMKSLITQAIRERRLLRLTYDGRARTVEPHVLGVTTDGQEAMLCWQVSPPIRQGGYWHLFLLNRIFSLRTLDSEIGTEPEGPQAPLNAFSEIHAVLQTSTETG